MGQKHNPDTISIKIRARFHELTARPAVKAEPVDKASEHFPFGSRAFIEKYKSVDFVP